jgi:hypothetical protein
MHERDDSARDRNVNGELSDEISFSRMFRIEKRVVVALERVTTVVDRNDSVEHDPVQQRAAIGHDVTDLIRTGPT